MGYKAKNNAVSTLAVGITSGATSLQVQTAHGDRFPAITAPDYTFITLEKADGSREIVKVTDRALGSDVQTIVRAQEGTTALAFSAGDIVECRPTAGVVEDKIGLLDTQNATSKTTPVNADEIPILDSAAGFSIKKLTWANLKTALSSLLQTSATGSAVLPVGTTAQRDGAPASGFLRFNTTLAQFEGFNGVGWSPLVADFAGSNIASAATIDLTAAPGNTLSVTGTVTTTAITMNGGQQIVLIAAGAWPLTYHATNCNINGGASYTCAAGDRLFVNKAADGVVRVNVIKQNGTAVVAPATNAISQLNSSVTVTDAGTGKVETTVDGTIIEELTLASRKSTIDGGATLYPEFKCRAWVNFNGTGTVAIRASGNVSSITDNGAGDYTINLATALPDANYSTCISFDHGNGASSKTGFVNAMSGGSTVAPTASAFRCLTETPGVGAVDLQYINLSVFR